MTQQVHDIRPFALIERAWNIVKKDKNLFVLWALLIGAILVSGFIQGAVEAAHRGGTGLGLIGEIVNMLVGAIVSIVMLRAIMRMVAGKPFVFDAIVPPAMSVVWYVVMQIIFTIIAFVIIFVGFVVAGVAIAGFFGVTVMHIAHGGEFSSLAEALRVAAPMLGVIVPIIFVILGVLMYVIIRYHLAAYVIAERGVDALTALRASALYTRGVKWRIVGFYAVTGILNFIGLLAFVVGLLITVPITAVASILLYNTLKTRAHDIAASSASKDEAQATEEVKEVADEKSEEKTEVAVDTKEAAVEEATEKTEVNSEEGEKKVS